jgi:hypothetical protein
VTVRVAGLVARRDLDAVHPGRARDERLARHDVERHRLRVGGGVVAKAHATIETCSTSAFLLRIHEEARPSTTRLSAAGTQSPAPGVTSTTAGPGAAATVERERDRACSRKAQAVILRNPAVMW